MLNKARQLNLPTMKKIFPYQIFLLSFLFPLESIQSNDYLAKDSTSIVGNWKSSTWFGYYHDDGSGWVYHEDLEWIYPSSPDGNSIWIFVPLLDWAWTRQDLFPWMYFNKLQNWRYYNQENGFYDYNKNAWQSNQVLSEELQGKDANQSAGESNSTTGQNGGDDSDESAPKTYSLDVFSGSGGFATGSGSFLKGNLASISATPETGYYFLNWTGDGVLDSNASSTSLLIDSNRTVTANFSLMQYILSVEAQSGGSVTGGNTYDFGQTVTISATPDTGYYFLNWTGDGVLDSNASSTSILIDANRSVTANFSLMQFGLTALAQSGGSVTGGNTYDFGQSATITATPDMGYYFVNWTGDGVLDTNASSTSVLIDSNRTVTANFSLLKPLLSISAEAGGSVSGAGSYEYNSNITVIASPDSGYSFLHWSGAQVANSSAANTTIHMTEDVNLTATFEASPTSSLSKVEPFEMVRRMGRGINLGNVLSAPEEGKWAPAATQQYFADLKDANFTNVRLPMDFYGTRTSGDTSGYSSLSGTSGDFNGSMDDFVVSSVYLDRIEEIINWSLNQGLITVLDFHGGNLKSEFLHTFNPSNSHYLDPTSARRAADLVKFQSIWRAIANRFKNYPPELLFEIVNEPYFELSAIEMDQLNSLVISIIRATGGKNNDRNLIIVGGGENSYLAPQQINSSILASDDQLIATFHYYDPFSFTSSQKDQYDDNDWGTSVDKESVNTHFDTVKTWSETNQIPIYLGEFGADNENGYDYGSGTLRKINSNATGYADGGPDAQSRILYHQYVAQEAINRGFAFSAWDSGPTSNKTIHKRNDSNLTSNFDLSSFAVSSFEIPTVTMSTVVDSTTWVSEIKESILNYGTWPDCYGPSGVIKNPGFECSPYNENWSLKLVSSSTAEISESNSTMARTGDAAIQIKVSSDLGYNKVLLENTSFVSDLNGKRITVECWVKSSVPASFRMQLKITEKEGVEYGNKYPSSDVFSTTTEYQKFIFRHTVNNSIDAVQFKLLLGKTPATFFIDDCSALIE